MQTLTLAELENFDNRSANVGKQRRFLCPICGENKPKDFAHRSLAVNTENGLYICHRCQSKGCLQEFWESRPITKKKNKTRLKLMSHFALDVIPKQKNDIPKQENLVETMRKYQAEFLNSPAEIYLLNRAISTDTINISRCGFAEKWEHWEKVNDRWNLIGTDRRVVFPIYDLIGNLVAIHGRAIDEKYFGSSKITKGDKSLGVFYTRQNIFKNEVLAICEGAIDAMALETMGTSAIAMTGTTPPDWLYRKMIFKKVLIATDADEAGDKSAQKLKIELDLRGVKSKRYRPQNAKDWNEYLQNIDKISYQTQLV